jgi:hypothetical protein
MRGDSVEIVIDVLALVEHPASDAAVADETAPSASVAPEPLAAVG